MNGPRTIAAPVTGATRRFFGGVGLLLRGLGLYVRSPGLMLLGVVPALLSAALFVAAFATLIYFVDELAAWVTPFADDWSDTPRSLVRVIAGLAFLGLGGLLTVVGFTAVTLVIGDPFYEKISERVEDRLGGTPGAVEVPFGASLRRSVVDSLRLVGLSVLFGIPLFLAGFIPVVGQTVVPVVGAAVGGWLLAVELVGAPFSRRGLRLPDRRARLKADRATSLGFGVAVFLCFLIPLGAVLVMPAAVAGAALLARRSLGQHIEES
ncbi:membrane protein [Micromonospora humidisoli]|uniref:EI24 domain-containing protein n=1 Tax=Micromonospora humidisoli TaxID=2807622 RepID=A0ABS2J6T3_9ACTN|nr:MULTISPECIES: EI24 domain-containing protein [Micromonospora]MBM7082266.1 EI24 domain-containing protein [Micromonospora humidisoli]GHJ11694.1 membrane protein [Micromonospora sp. AKA109]